MHHKSPLIMDQETQFHRHNKTMTSLKKPLDTSSLKVFENAAAGHDGVLSDQSGALFIKPCTAAELAFYQQTLAEYPNFAEFMPTFMGTLQLGAPPQAVNGAAGYEMIERAEAQQRLYGAKITAETGIVLENLEHGFTHPNVLDLKLGARLYADGTRDEKAARLDKVASETTSGSLGFRIAGMKVWNGSSFDIYDKLYGRHFNANNVKDGFATFFAGLRTSLDRDATAQILEMLQAEIVKVRHALERTESRMYSASILVIYEGDSDALKALIHTEPKRPRVDERAPTSDEVGEIDVEETEEDDELEDDELVAYHVRLIDFAHATWTPGSGKDDNVIAGLKNIEKQLDQLILHSR